MWPTELHLSGENKLPQFLNIKLEKWSAQNQNGEDSPFLKRGIPQVGHNHVLTLALLNSKPPRNLDVTGTGVFFLYV